MLTIIIFGVIGAVIGAVISYKVLNDITEVILYVSGGFLEL